MQRDRRVYLLDGIKAAELIIKFVSDTSLSEYEADEMLHSAVERQFEIIGEALRRLASIAPESVAQIHSLRRIVAFRNQLAHGYFAVQHDIVWAIATRDIPVVLSQLRGLLSNAED